MPISSLVKLRVLALGYDNDVMKIIVVLNSGTIIIYLETTSFYSGFDLADG